MGRLIAQLESALEDDGPNSAVLDFDYGGNPWDAAHEVIDNPDAASLNSTVAYVEPDFVQGFPYRSREPESALESFDSAEACSPTGPDESWPSGPFGWHLADEFTQLLAAREAVGDPGDGNRIKIGILDTGYDPGHKVLPLHLRLDQARNFTDRGELNDATDPASTQMLTNPGHGIATMGILAGAKVQARDGSFDDFLGGTPYAEVVPIRIADSVAHFKTSSMAAGIRYAADIGCDVVSISMGGVPSREWAEAVNYAYEKGVCIFAAAGNRIGVSPPSTLIYPARFNRVVAVCGFTADKKPYFKEGFHRQMQGSFGPESAMGTAMGAFTPNVPWAAIGCGDLVNPDGAGTSSATPQCAAAAALWLQKHRPSPTEKWQVIEAVRNALFTTADKSIDATTYYKGNGLLKAADALDVEFTSSVTKQPRDSVSFPWLRLLGALESDGEPDGKQQMLETEALQMFSGSPRLQEIGGGAAFLDSLEVSDRQRLIDAMLEYPTASASLKEHLQRLKEAN